MTEPKHVFINAIETTDVVNLLRQVIVDTGREHEGKKIVEYIPGYSDTKVAEEIGGKVRAGHVRTLRGSHFGKLYISGRDRGLPKTNKKPVAIDPDVLNDLKMLIEWVVDDLRRNNLIGPERFEGYKTVLEDISA